MLLLFETPAGFSLFKVKDEGKLEDVEVRAPCVLTSELICHRRRRDLCYLERRLGLAGVLDACGARARAARTRDRRDRDRFLANARDWRLIGRSTCQNAHARGTLRVHVGFLRGGGRLFLQ